MLDLEPKGAIEGLDESRVQDLPPDLVRQRARLRAQALNNLGRSAEALATIEKDASPEADLLRLGIHWGRNQWRQAATVFGRLFGNADGERLDRGQGRLVLQLAIALVLSEQSAALDRLRARFGKAMMRGPNAEAFEAIAGRDPGKAPDYKALAKRAGDLATFEAFVTSYRNHLKASRLSAVN